MTSKHLTPYPSIDQLPPELHAYWVSGGEITERPAVFDENLSTHKPAIEHIHAIFSLHDLDDVIEKNLRCILSLCCDDSMWGELKKLKMGQSGYHSRLFVTPDTPKGMVEACCFNTFTHKNETHEFHFEMQWQVGKLAQSKSMLEYTQIFENTLNSLREKILLNDLIKPSTTLHGQPTSKI